MAVNVREWKQVWEVDDAHTYVTNDEASVKFSEGTLAAEHNVKPTADKTRYVSATEPNRLMLFGGTSHCLL
jgi:hypothetical protein